MAVNHADGMLFVSTVLYPIAAGMGAADAGARWLMVLFIPAGLAVGIGIVYVGRKLIYAITGFGLNATKRIHKGWLQQVFFAPFFIFYLFTPLAIIAGGVLGIRFGSYWLVGHLF
jgi:hypothetical protein